jgi:hypothetical protein
MASNQQVILQAGSVPTETCFESIQQLYNTFINNTTAYVAGGYSLFNYGDSTPAVDDQDRPWVRTIGGKPDRIYSFVNGKWISKHSIPAGGNVRQMWVGSEVELETYDGGESGTAKDMAGPFWTVDTDMSARFPVGVGDFAAAVKGTGGEENHTLLTAEMPAHKHAPFAGGKKIWHDKYLGSSQEGTTGDTRVRHFGDGPEGAGISLAEDLYKEAGDGEAHNNLPPYYGVYFIKRTSRIYYTV